MAARNDYPDQDKLDELRETLERTGLLNEKTEKRVKATATSRRRYEKIIHQAKLRLVQELGRDWPLPLPNYPGRFLIGRDLGGRSASPTAS